MDFGNRAGWLRATAVLCAGLIAPGGPLLRAQEQAAAEEKPKLKSADQLDSLIAPIALYPDPLLAQVLAASTYPLEVVQAQRWLKENAKLKGEELTKGAAKQPWDPSVQALVAFPQALKLLDDNIQWTTEVGNAFLDQQGDVMDAIQRMRKKAKDSGKLDTSKEQKVEVKTVESKTVIEIQPADPQVIYVPSYNPTVVYGAAPVYAYPPVAYPAYSAGAVAATAAISFGAGVMMGAMWGGCCGGGGYGWGMGWGNNNVTINNNFNNRYGYNNINNIQGGNRTNVGSGNRGGNSWQHNPTHRGAVPYDNRGTAQRFGRNTPAGQRTDRAAGQRSGISGGADRGANRSQAGDRGLDGNRGQSGARGNQDRIGNRNIGGDSGGRQGAFGGGGSDSRARTQAASDRGFASTRDSGGGNSGRTSARQSSGGASRSSASRSAGGGSRSAGGGRRRR